MIGVNCVTDEKYIQNQKDFIKRERRIILRDHWGISSLLLLVLAIFIFLSAIGYQHPSGWQETTITLDHYEDVYVHRGGHRIYMYGTDGNCYLINRHTLNIKEHLVTGQQYSFAYGNSFFRSTVMALDIDGVEYLRYEDSEKRYWDYNAIFWVLDGLVIIGLIVANYINYRTHTSARIKKIRRYQKRIYDKEHKMK